MKRYPRITAHIIAESLGYATRKNYCEWIYSCYGSDPLPAVKNAIRNRHHHKGYMAEYRIAKKLVDHALDTGEEPVFASWF